MKAKNSSYKQFVQNHNYLLILFGLATSAFPPVLKKNAYLFSLGKRKTVAYSDSYAFHRITQAHSKLVLSNRFVPNIKAVLKLTHRGVSTKDLQPYLIEVLCRFNGQFLYHELFNRFPFTFTNGVPITRYELLETLTRLTVRIYQG